MRKYSPILGLMIIVSVMIMSQMGTHEVSGSTTTTIYQCGQTDLGLGELSGMPDLKTMDWSRTKSVANQVDNGAAAVMLAEAEEEGHGSETGEETTAPGGFDRLWDVVSNG
ncbi:MAG: hypothetical protein ACLQO6_18210 [Desulfomonilaceae bacterium]